MESPDRAAAARGRRQIGTESQLPRHKRCVSNHSHTSALRRPSEQQYQPYQPPQPGSQRVLPARVQEQSLKHKESSTVPRPSKICIHIERDFSLYKLLPKVLQTVGVENGSRVGMKPAHVQKNQPLVRLPPSTDIVIKVTHLSPGAPGEQGKVRQVGKKTPLT